MENIMKAIIENIDFKNQQIIVEYIDPYENENVKRAVRLPREITQEDILNEIKLHTPDLYFKEQNDLKNVVDDGKFDHLKSLIGTTIDYEVGVTIFNSEVY
jgi:hypothetical protein